ncbi:MAG TPA: polysaccharide biosynthesis tyrosine autokinase [Usitatibacter sp.]|nr:polysaccharide biosynthesis tyrosine autokinase [Usitatibacter sp.]
MSIPSDSRGHSARTTALAIPPRSALATELAGPGAAAAEPLEQSLHLRDLLRIFLKRKWTILAIFSVSALFSVVMTYLAPPVYRASTTIQIERFVPRVLDFKETSSVDNSEYWSDGSDFYFTNYELLKSRALAERAVEDLGLRKPPAPADRPVSEQAPAEDGNPVGNLFSWLRRGPPPVAVDPASRKDYAVVGAFQSSLTVEPVRKSRLVRLHFDSTDPFFAAKAVNTLAQSFININLERRFEASSYAKTFLEEKLLQTKAKLEESERELVKFSRDSQIVNIDEKQNIVGQNLQEFNSAVAKAEQERIRAEALYKQALDSPHAIFVGQDNRNWQSTQTLQALRQSKAKLDAEYQDALKVYKPAFPKMIQMKAQSDELQRQIATEIEELRKSLLSSYRATQQQEAALKQKLEFSKQEQLSLQGRNIRYSILKREVDTNRQLYDGLLQRLKEVGIAGGVGVNNVFVVDKAQVPLGPFKPNLGRNLGMGLAIGLVIGLLVAWLLEYFDDSIRFADDVERETGAAVLGVIPKLKLEPGKPLLVAMSPHDDPNSAFSEAYRSVRTALQFSTASGAPRRLVVTSSSKGEGKSTTALSLAINFAQMGKPVLIIDADLRNPVLHKLLGIENSRGLSNYLSSNMGPLEAIHRTEIPNLFVMTTGPLPPNPVELLSSMKLLALLSQCEEHFAHVIVDGPPVLGIADAIVLCNQVDNSVFVVESGKTRKGHAKAALKRLQQAGVHPLGVILTKIDAFHDLYGYHSYYYQYAKPALPGKQTAEAA